ncbi:MAG: hypothetical protein V2A72_07025 [Candidatus Omnitrophota bacterium]
MFASCNKHFNIFLLSVLIILHAKYAAAAGRNDIYGSGASEVEKPTPYTKVFIDEDNNSAQLLRKNSLIESKRGACSETGTSFYFSELYFDLGKIVSEDVAKDQQGRPIKSNQIIKDPANASIAQQRLLDYVKYDQENRPTSYQEEIFITAKDYLTDTIVRLFSKMDVYKVEYDTSGKPATILANTEVVISDDKGNTLLTIKGTFTKRARFNANGKIDGYYRYGIDNIILEGKAGEIVITAPPLISDTQGAKEQRVGIVTVTDEKYLNEILNSKSFIKQLLAKFGLLDLFYKAFYSEKFYTSLSYLEIQNTPEEIMSLSNITSAFKALINERHQAYALFQDDVDSYYEKLATSLFDNIDLWWDVEVTPQEYYAGEDKILSQFEYRKMIDDAIVTLSARSGSITAAMSIPQQILSLEQYLRSQMIANSKQVYVENLKSSVSNMNVQISLAIRNLNRPVIVHGKDTIEALLILPEKSLQKGKKR